MTIDTHRANIPRMETFEVFREHLHYTLNHLYDPEHEPAELLYRVIGCASSDGAGPLQTAIAQAIAAMEPPAEVPLESGARRIYVLLHHRFVLQLTQEETAERMDLSVRHLRRVQQEAVHALAQRLWETWTGREATTSGGAELIGERPDPSRMSLDESDSWRSQVRQDLESLQEGDAVRLVAVRDAVQTAVELGRVVAASHGILVDVVPVDSELVAAANPSAVRQALITAMGHIIEHAGRECSLIEVCAAQTRPSVTVQVSCGSSCATDSPKLDLLREIVRSQNGSVDVLSGDAGFSIQIHLVSPGQIRVLVVDDNRDLVHYYRRCVRGTRYHITHSTEGANILDTVGATQPDIIVLDIMLPDVDGWELLTLLHQNALTRDIPIVACSVMREEELALALGAAIYVSKPVQHQEFIQALDQALLHASKQPPRSPAHSGVAG
ncbi:MAG: response regulator [Chloroflexi bacterium]|nr:response regulator [Chloroflexota bacterium]